MATCRVYVVDDDAAMRSLLRVMFQLESGMELVGEAACGEEALAAIAALDRDRSPDIVVLDYDMDGMDGLETAAALAELDGYDRVIVMHTAHAGLFEPTEHIHSVVTKGTTTTASLPTQLREIWAGAGIAD